MNETVVFEHICALVAQQTGKSPDAVLRPLVGELWARRDADTPPDRAPLGAAAALGPYFVEQGVTASEAVRDVLRVGRAFVDEAAALGLDGAGARRLSALVDEAAAQVAQAVEAARRARRQSWLSYLVHEVKNPLNTILNALWLLREKGSDPVQATRFLELAERAVKRLEGRARDVRQLDEQLVTPPPGWQSSTLANRAPGSV